MPRKRNIKQMKKLFRVLADELVPDEKEFKQYVTMVKKVRQEKFDTGKAPDGSSWRKLKPATVKAKKLKGSPNSSSPLIDESKLRTGRATSDSKGGYFRLLKSRSKKVWNGKSIAEIHNEGTSRIPKREHFAIYPEAIEQILKKFRLKFVRKLRAKVNGGK